VGTHIRYLGDGRNLSLMEMDILRTTGCKWSKIIFQGFKGYLKPQDKDMMYKSPVFDPKIEVSPGVASLSNFMESFNREYVRIVDGPGRNGGLRNSEAKNKSLGSEKSL
jgi:hypothetical protein